MKISLNSLAQKILLILATWLLAFALMAVQIQQVVSRVETWLWDAIKR
jgi:hypothetical protein